MYMFFKMDDAESCCTKTGKKERAGYNEKREITIHVFTSDILFGKQSDQFRNSQATGCKYWGGIVSMHEYFAWIIYQNQTAFKDHKVSSLETDKDSVVI